MFLSACAFGQNSQHIAFTRDRHRARIMLEIQAGFLPQRAPCLGAIVDRMSKRDLRSADSRTIGRILVKGVHLIRHWFRSRQQRSCQ